MRVVGGVASKSWQEYPQHLRGRGFGLTCWEESSFPAERAAKATKCTVSVRALPDKIGVKLDIE